MKASHAGTGNPAIPRKNHVELITLKILARATIKPAVLSNLSAHRILLFSFLFQGLQCGTVQGCNGSATNPFHGADSITSIRGRVKQEIQILP